MPRFHTHKLHLDFRWRHLTQALEMRFTGVLSCITAKAALRTPHPARPETVGSV